MYLILNNFKIRVIFNRYKNKAKNKKKLNNQLKNLLSMNQKTSMKRLIIQISNYKIWKINLEFKSLQKLVKNPKKKKLVECAK